MGPHRCYRIIIFTLASLACLDQYFLLHFHCNKNESNPIVALHRDTYVDTATLPLRTETSSKGTSWLQTEKLHELRPLSSYDKEFYTVRLNTWKRPEHLRSCLEYLVSCPGIAQIQVIWYNDAGTLPDFLADYPSNKVVIEEHKENSLNERFKILKTPPTLGILSIDDDMIRTCEAMDNGFFRWTRSPERMVGYEARSHVPHGPPRHADYRKDPLHSNKYSMAVTSFAFLHQDYLHTYTNTLPKPVYVMVQQLFNCEDLAMSMMITSLTGGKPPLLADRWAIWMNRVFLGGSDYDISREKTSHYRTRDACISIFSFFLHLDGAGSGQEGYVPWENVSIHGGIKNETDALYPLYGAQDDRMMGNILTVCSTDSQAMISTSREQVQRDLLCHWNASSAQVVSSFMPPLLKVFNDHKNRTGTKGSGRNA